MAGKLGGGGGGGTIVQKGGGRPIAAPVVHWGNPDTIAKITLDDGTVIDWFKAGVGSSDAFGNSKNLFQNGSSNDKWTGGTGTDFLDGGAGNDTLKGGLGDDVLVGGTGADRIEGTGGSELAYGPIINGLDTGTVRIGANAPGGGGWLSPKDPLVQSSAAFTAFKITIDVDATENSTVTNPDGSVAHPSRLVHGSYPSTSGLLWELTPGTGLSAGHAALVTPHWDPSITSTATNTVINADGTASTTTTVTKGAFVIPTANTQVSDTDLLLGGAGIKETMKLDFMHEPSKVAIGFDVLFVGMSGDGNPSVGTAGAVHWKAVGDDGAVLSEGDFHNIAGSTTVRAGATFSADVAHHLNHLEFTPTDSTVVLPQEIHISYTDASKSDGDREQALISEFGIAVTSHQSNNSLFPITLSKDGAGKVTGATWSPNPSDVGIKYTGDILTGGDANSLNGDGAADIFVLGTGMQDIRDFETGLDKIQVGIADTTDLAYAVRDALEIAHRDHHEDLLLLPQGTALWNEHGTSWKASDFVAATAAVTVQLFTADTFGPNGMLHFTAGLGLNDLLGWTG